MDHGINIINHSMDHGMDNESITVRIPVGSLVLDIFDLVKIKY